jgi:hypothetical protein
MAIVLPSSWVEEEVMVGVTCTSPLPSMVATISEEETTSLTSNNTVETGSNTFQTGKEIDPMLVSRGVS